MGQYNAVGPTSTWIDGSYTSLNILQFLKDESLMIKLSTNLRLLIYFSDYMSLHCIVM